jgi:DNA-directed RNA polymerase subunit K/omega
MSSQEARFINEQANLGFIKLDQKPTTIAIQKFKDGKLEIIKEAEAG